jgi:hypothetical protein
MRYSEVSFNLGRNRQSKRHCLSGDIRSLTTSHVNVQSIDTPHISLARV